MTQDNFMLSCVHLLKLKQQNKLIFDEKYDLLGFHYSTTVSQELMVCEILSFIIKTNNDEHCWKFVI